MKIIGVSGKIGSGKTTLCNILKEKLIGYGYKVEIINFADKLKRICYELTGHYGYTQEDKNVFIPEYSKNVGEILQYVGTNLFRDNFDKEVWIKAAFINLNEDTVYILGDCRFENEAKAIQEKQGVLIRLNGDPEKIRENSKRDLNHPSETSLDNYDNFDFIYDNVGSLKDLFEFSEKIIEFSFFSNRLISINEEINLDSFSVEKIKSNDGLYCLLTSKEPSTINVTYESSVGENIFDDLVKVKLINGVLYWKGSRNKLPNKDVLIELRINEDDTKTINCLYYN